MFVPIVWHNLEALATAGEATEGSFKWAIMNYCVVCPNLKYDEAVRISRMQITSAIATVTKPYTTTGRDGTWHRIRMTHREETRLRALTKAKEILDKM